MTWIHPISADTEAPASVLGGKGHGLVTLRRLGLPVPAGFVIGTAACRAFLREGRLPAGLDEELTAAVAGLERATGRRLGGAWRPLVVAVRSGSGVSMPGMMNTILNLGLTARATAALAAETGDARFALDSRLRFVTGFAAAVAGVPAERLDAVRGDGGPADLASAIRDVEALIRDRTGDPVPDDAARQLRQAVAAVFSSWHTPRATTYRELHGIPHDLGTAVTVQAMAFGNRDARSGSGVAFSRDPTTGDSTPYGDVLFGRQGEDVVSGRSATRPLAELAVREPAVWDGLREALRRVEGWYRDACQVEFTFEAGELWILQVRPGGLTGRAAVRVAVDLADEGVVSRREALLRITPDDLRHVRTPRLEDTGTLDVLARGIGACPGVASGRVATTADAAVRRGAAGPVVLVRPQTAPLDRPGRAAAAGIVPARGGPAGHAAVVARALGRPAVVGAADLVVDPAAGCVRAAGRVLPEGTLVTVDGTGGVIVAGRPRVVTGPAGPHLDRLLAWADEVAGEIRGEVRGGITGAGRGEAERLAAARPVLEEGRAVPEGGR